MKDTKWKNIFLTEKKVLIGFLKIIGVQNQWLGSFGTPLLEIRIFCLKSFQTKFSYSYAKFLSNSSYNKDTLKMESQK